MNEREIAEIRRRFNPDTSNISTIRGCYVNENGEILSEFHQSLHTMPESESEKFLALLKKTLSGGLDKNLLNIEFSTQQVVDSEEHRLFMTLRDSALQDEEAVAALFQRVTREVALEENYVIILALDNYDVPYRAKDGARLDDASGDVFSYILCSVCPVKPAKPALSYRVRENLFQSRMVEQIVAPPEMGFMFPAFDDRQANIYGALYYTRDGADNHPEFVDALFKSDIPLPADRQKEIFQALLSDALAEDCRFDIVQSVHNQLQEMIEEHKANKEEEPLTISKDVVKRVLETSGAPAESIEAYDVKFEQEFGADARIAPRNVVDAKRIEITAPDIKIHVRAESGDMVETRVIDGVKYIMIRVEDGVQVNGVPIHIN